MRPQLLAIWALVLSWLLAFTLDNWAFLLLGTLDEVRSGELMLIFFCASVLNSIIVFLVHVTRKRFRSGLSNSTTFGHR